MATDIKKKKLKLIEFRRLVEGHTVTGKAEVKL